MTFFVLCCFVSVIFFAPSQSSNRDTFKPSGGCVSGACPRVPTVRGQNGCDSANDSFRRCRWSEALTFGAACICDAFWREICPDSTEADSEIVHSGVSFVTVIRRTLGDPAWRVNAHSTYKNISALRVVVIFRTRMNTQRRTSSVASCYKNKSKARCVRMRSGQLPT